MFFAQEAGQETTDYRKDGAIITIKLLKHQQFACQTEMIFFIHNEMRLDTVENVSNST